MAEGIHYVCVGNVAGHDGNNTYCHHCKHLPIERRGYFIPTDNLTGNQGKFCNTTLPGVWQAI
jgi:pyruvate formate lyase activating enzyme